MITVVILLLTVAVALAEIAVGPAAAGDGQLLGQIGARVIIPMLRRGRVHPGPFVLKRCGVIRPGRAPGEKVLHRAVRHDVAAAAAVDVTENERFALPVIPEVGVFALAVERVVKIGRGRAAVGVGQENDFEVDDIALKPHLPDHVAERAQLRVVIHAVAVVKNQNVNAGVREQGDLAAQHPRIARIVIAERRLAPPIRRVHGLHDGIVGPRIVRVGVGMLREILAHIPVGAGAVAVAVLPQIIKQADGPVGARRTAVRQAGQGPIQRVRCHPCVFHHIDHRRAGGETVNHAWGRRAIGRNAIHAPIIRGVRQQPGKVHRERRRAPLINPGGVRRGAGNQIGNRAKKQIVGRCTGNFQPAERERRRQIHREILSGGRIQRAVEHAKQNVAGRVRVEPNRFAAGHQTGDQSVQRDRAGALQAGVNAAAETAAVRKIDRAGERGVAVDLDEPVCGIVGRAEIEIKFRAGNRRQSAARGRAAAVTAHGQRAAAGDGNGPGKHAGAGERGGIDRERRATIHRAVHRERAGVHRGSGLHKIAAVERERGAAVFVQRIDG